MAGLCLAMPPGVLGAGEFNLTSSNYVQNFDGFGTNAVVEFPPGFKMTPNFPSNTTQVGIVSWTNGANVMTTAWAASSGTPTNTGRYNWGATGGTDRALGVMSDLKTLGGGSAILAGFTNNTGNTITQILAGFVWEQYRTTNVMATNLCYFSLDGTKPSWTLQSSNIFAGGSHAYGYPLATTTVSVTKGGLAITNGGRFYFLFHFTQPGVKNEGWALDDLSLELQSVGNPNPPPDTNCTPGAVEYVQHPAEYSWYKLFGGYADVGSNLFCWTDLTGDQVAGWRTFRTDGGGGGNPRPLEPGDRFRITLSGDTTYGVLGLSLNDGVATNTWPERLEHSRGYIACSNRPNPGYDPNDESEYYDLRLNLPGELTAGSLDGETAWPGVLPSQTNVTVDFYILSSREFTAAIAGQDPKSDLPMLNDPGDGDRIDGYSIFCENTGNGASNAYGYWMPETSVTNLGYVELGADGGSRTIAGQIADGLNAACTNMPSPNRLVKSGAGAVTLGHTNNLYTLDTEIAGGTLLVSADTCLGAAPAAVSNAHIKLAGGATLAATETFILNTNRGIAVSGGDASLAVAAGQRLTYNGIVADGDETNAILKAQGGELILGGSSTFEGGTYIGDGTLTMNHSNALGSGSIYLGDLSDSNAATLNLGSALTAANDLAVRAGSAGVKTLRASAPATLSGNITNDETGAGLFAIDVADAQMLTLAGAINGAGGFAKTGTGTLFLSGTNLYAGGTAVEAGTLLLSGSAGSSAVTVAPGATLAGAGSAGPLTAGGLVDPGNAAGARATLSCADLALEAGGVLRVDISGASGTPGTDWDLVGASGVINVNTGGIFTIRLHGTPAGFGVAQGYRWAIMSGAAVEDFSAGRFAVDTNDFLSATDGGTFSVNQSGTDVVLDFAPRVPEAPAFAAAPAGVSSVTLTFTSTDPVVIVANETGSFSAPAGTAPAAGSAFAGGTVVCNGAGSPQTHSGLPSCLRQYYSAWACNGTNYSAATLDDAETDPPGAPAGLHAASTNATDFLARWTASAGAGGYRLDVSEHAGFEAALVSGYSNRAVAGTEQSVTGLAGAMTYYFRVRAEGAGGCTSAHSTTSSVTTRMEDQTIDFPVIPDQLATNAVELAATASSGLTVGFAVAGGPAAISGGTMLTFTGAGEVRIEATQSGDARWNPAPARTNVFTVTPVAAEVVLGDLSQTFDGTPRSATVTTMPPGLAVDVTYDGLSNAPSAVGSYEVVAVVAEALYAGGATGTLSIAAETVTNVFEKWLENEQGQSTNDPDFAPEADMDLDGMTTWEEFLADTDPAWSGSVLRITGTYSSVGREVRLAFPASTSRYYQLVYATNLLHGSAQSNLGWGTPGMVVTNSTSGSWYGGVRSLLTNPP